MSFVIVSRSGRPSGQDDGGQEAHHRLAMLVLDLEGEVGAAAVQLGARGAQVLDRGLGMQRVAGPDRPECRSTRSLLTASLSPVYLPLQGLSKYIPIV